MRLFLAIDVNDAVRDEMRRVRAAVELSLAAMRSSPRLTWVDPEIAHVTLQFLGDIDESRAAALQQVLQPALEIAPFAVTWRDVGAYPSAKAPRAIWMGESGAADRLSALAASVAARVERVVEPREARPFRAHVTIARVRDHTSRVDWRRVLDGVPTRGAVSTVDHVTLYESRLWPKGPTYTALSHARLA